MQRARTLAAISLVGALSLGPALAASAADGNWGPTTPISDPSARDPQPQVVTDGSTITAAWLMREDSGPIRVQASVSADSGATWSTPQFLSVASGHANAPTLVTDGTTITVVWVRNDGLNQRIETSSSTDGGNSWSSAVAITPSGTNAVDPRVVSDGTTITVAWERLGPPFYRIQSASSSDGGATWSAPVNISPADVDAYNPELVTDGATVTVTWEQHETANSRVYAASSSDDGATWSTPALLSTVTGDAYNPRIVRAGTSIVVGWEQQLSPHYGILSSVSTDDGATWSTPSVMSHPSHIGNEVRLATDGTAVVAVWQEFHGPNWRILASTSLDGGGAWSGGVLVSDAATTSSISRVTMSDGAITAAWQFLDGSHQGIQVTSSTDGGATWSTPEALSLGGASSLSPRLASGGGTVTAVWQYDASIVHTSSITWAADPDPEPGTGEGEGGLAATGADEAATLTIAAFGLLAAGMILIARRRTGDTRARS